MINAVTQETAGVSMESVRTNSLDLFTKLGWEFSKKEIPSWVNWK